MQIVMDNQHTELPLDIIIELARALPPVHVDPRKAVAVPSSSEIQAVVTATKLSKVLIWDTETTGNGRDQRLTQIAVLDPTSNEIFNRYVKVDGALFGPYCPNKEEMIAKCASEGKDLGLVVQEFVAWINEKQRDASVLLYAHNANFDRRVIKKAWKMLHSDQDPPPDPPWHAWTFACSYEFTNAKKVNAAIRPELQIPYKQRSIKALTRAYSIKTDKLHFADADCQAEWKVIWNLFAERTGSSCNEEIYNSIISWGTQGEIPKNALSAPTPTSATLGSILQCLKDSGCKRKAAKKCRNKMCCRHCASEPGDCKQHKKQQAEFRKQNAEEQVTASVVSVTPFGSEQVRDCKMKISVTWGTFLFGSYGRQKFFSGVFTHCN